MAHGAQPVHRLLDSCLECLIQNHRTIKYFGLEEAFKGHASQPFNFPNELPKYQPTCYSRKQEVGNQALEICSGQSEQSIKGTREKSSPVGSGGGGRQKDRSCPTSWVMSNQQIKKISLNNFTSKSFQLSMMWQCDIGGSLETVILSFLQCLRRN